MSENNVISNPTAVAVSAQNFYPLSTSDLTTTATTSGHEEEDKDHLNNRLFSCDQCEKVFTRKHNLETHKLVHSQSKPYTCAICKSGFKRSHDLKRHQRMHTGEKPHMCTKCDRSFARADALLRHTKNGCSSGSIIGTNLPKLVMPIADTSRSPSIIGKNDIDNNDKKTYETVHWKLSVPSNDISLREQFNKVSNAMQDRHPSYSSFPQTPIYDITNNQSNTRTTSISEKELPQHQNFFESSNVTSKINFLESKIKLLEKQVDNDQFKIRDLESRLSKLENSSK